MRDRDPVVLHDAGLALARRADQAAAAIPYAEQLAVDLPWWQRPFARQLVRELRRTERASRAGSVELLLEAVARYRELYGPTMDAIAAETLAPPLARDLLAAAVGAGASEST